MSVEISGPKGYEVQYLVTLWIALLAEISAPETASVRIEEKEDAEVSLTVDGSVLQIAMQSKYQAGDLDLSTLASWLAHFAPRDDAESLLGRLLADQNLVALFVTQSRAGDSTRNFLKFHGNWQPHTAPPLNEDSTRQLAAALGEIYKSGKTSLQKRRADKCLHLGRTLIGEEAGSVLQRVIIWEQITETRVKDEIARLLTAFRIVPEQTEQVTDALLGRVRAARDKRGEFMSDLRSILRGSAADRMLRKLRHTPRLEETTLAVMLEGQRVLWLTGRSLSGKTHTGQALAQALQDRGVACLETDDIKVARTFLARDELHTRLVLLDDSLLQAANPLRAWETLAKLAETLPHQHRLIVTAKLEHLVEIDPQFVPGKPDMFGWTWCDLTVRDRKFLLDYWNSLAEENKLPTSVVAIVVSYIDACDDREVLQPGQLRHLARIPIDQLLGKSLYDLLRIARFKAHQLARELAQEDIGRMLCFALGMGATTKNGMDPCEIGFLLSKATERPALPKENDAHFVRPFPEDDEEPEPAHFPTYNNRPALPQEMSVILRTFERRGFIVFVDRRFRFAHPDYREAFQERIFIEAGSGIEDALEMLDRAFGALDSAVGVSAARLVGLWLRSISIGETVFLQRIIEIAFYALQYSIFPNVRAATMLALLQQLDRLNETQEKELLRIALWTDPEESSVTWSGDMAWFDSSRRSWLDDHLRSRRTLPIETVLNVVARLKDSRLARDVSGPESDAVNSAYLHQDHLKPDPEVLTAQMNRDEVFIRADATRIVMTSLCVQDARLRQRVFEDEHPIVLAQAVKVAFENWSTYSSATREDLHQRIRVVLRDPAVAVISSRWLFDLGDEHSDYHSVQWAIWTESEKRSVWSLWSDVMGIALRTLGPRRFWMKTGDFFGSTRSAVKWLTPEEACQFAEAWLIWIEEQTKRWSLDDYAVSIAEFLLDTTTKSPEMRGTFVARLLRSPETDVVALNLGDLVDRWYSLLGRERQEIWCLLRSNREDVEWLRAVVITREEPPPELVTLVTGRPNFLHLSPIEQTASLPNSLLASCLQLYTGPAGWGLQITVPKAARLVWYTILKVQLSTATQPFFLLALSNLLSCAALNARTDSAIVAQWAEICEVADESTRTILFRELLNMSLAFHHSQLSPLWKVFFELSFQDGERIRYISEIADHLEGLSYSHNDWRALIRLFGERVFDEMLRHSASDYFMVRAIAAVPTPGEPPELATSMLALIETTYRVSPPRILLVHQRIAAWLKAMDTDEARLVAMQVEKSRLVTVDKGTDQADGRRPFESKVYNWIAQSAK